MNHEGLLQRHLGPDATTRHWAWLCLLSALGLTLMGVHAIDVGSAVEAPTHMGQLSPRAVRQMVYAGIGLVGALVIMLAHPRVARALSWPMFLAALALLAVLILPGVPSSVVRPRNGVRAWIDLGFIDFQPSELARVAFVLVAADYLRLSRRHRTFAGLIPPALIAFVPIALIMLQPDLGVSLLFIPALLAVLIGAGSRLSHLTIIVLAAVLATPAMFPFLKPYQQQRIVSMFSGLRDPKSVSDDHAFQQRTGITLVGAGGLTGLGEDKARAVVHYSALPERHNDMIFAVIVARHGLIGALVVFALYGLYILGALVTAGVTKDPWARLSIVGLTAMVAAQMVVNTGMVAGVLPVIGLTLPFVSSGGTSMIMMWGITGLILSVASRKPARVARESFHYDD